MLACARIGAIHTVVFGGFSAEALRDRINDAGAKILITADGGYRRGPDHPAEARRGLRRPRDALDRARGHRPARQFPAARQEGRDVWYHRLIQDAAPYCEPVACDSEDILFILYTSGTTGKPKGIIHTTGGYLVGDVHHDQADLRPPPRRRLLVHRGHRMGDRALVHRLRPSGRGRDVRHVRGRAGLARPGPLLGDRQQVRRHASSTRRRRPSALS